MKIRRRDLLVGLGGTAALAACTPRSATEPPRSAAASPQPSSLPAKPAASPPGPKKILILGGTGFVGPGLVRLARARGHTITLFNRGKTNPHLFPDVETILGNRKSDMDRLKGRDWDVVVDTWAPFPRIVREATEVLKDHVGHYVYVSTISVYKLGRDPIDESSTILTTPDETVEKVDGDTYGPLKALSEQAAEKAMPGRTTTVRSGVIVGPGDPTDRFLYWPLRLSRGGEMIVPGARTDRMQFIDVRDLDAFIVTAIEERVMGTYNTVGPTDPSFPAVLDAMKSGLHSDARFEWIDKKWLDANDAGGWENFPLAVSDEDDECGFAKVSAARAIAKGLRFRSPGESARDALAWWNEQPEERRAKKRPGISPEREASILARWHARASTK